MAALVAMKHIAAASCCAAACLLSPMPTAAEAEAPSCPRILSENWTHQPFKTVRRDLGGRDGISVVAGTSIRCMMNWCSLPIARAYAFALYVDQDMLASVKAAAQDDAPASRLVAAKIASPACGDATIVLKMARDIDGEHLAHGFFNSVSARWAKRTGANSAPTQASQPAEATAGDKTAPLAQIRALADQFNGLKLAMGDEVVFRWNRDGTLHTTLQGGISPPRAFVVQDTDVIAALFAVYTGKGAVSEEGRATFDANLRSMADLQAAGEADASALLAPVVQRHVSER